MMSFDILVPYNYYNLKCRRVIPPYTTACRALLCYGAQRERTYE